MLIECQENVPQTWLTSLWRPHMFSSPCLPFSTDKQVLPTFSACWQHPVQRDKIEKNYSWYKFDNCKRYAVLWSIYKHIVGCMELSENLQTARSLLCRAIASIHHTAASSYISCIFTKNFRCEWKGIDPLEINPGNLEVLQVKMFQFLMINIH